MTEEEILTKLKRIIADETGIKEGEITLETTFEEIEDWAGTCCRKQS